MVNVFNGTQPFANSAVSNNGRPASLTVVWGRTFAASALEHRTEAARAIRHVYRTHASG